jgi:hypothetical protein
VYEISNLSVSFNFGHLLPSYHRYKFEFNEDTVVVPSTNSFIPRYALSLIGGENIIKKRDEFPYMIGELLFFIFLFLIWKNDCLG